MTKKSEAGIPSKPTKPEEPRVCTIVIEPSGAVYVHGNITLDELARISFNIALRQASQPTPVEPIQ